jgi:hypothetical protein
MASYGSGSLELSAAKTERTYIKVCLGALAGLIVFVLICWAGHGVYVRWQERRLIRQAVGALGHNDLRQANLAARTVLEIKPNSAAASRIIAEVAERTGDRIAIDWRRRVAQMEPRLTEDILAWARSALQFNDITTAEKAMAEVDEGGRQLSGYHAVAALLAQVKQQPDLARTEWSEAVRLSPGDSAYRLQFAVAELGASDPGAQQAGIDTLVSLQKDPAQRVAATRALIGSAVTRHRSNAEVLDLGRTLQSFPESTFYDRLLYLDLLRQAGGNDFAAYLNELEHRTADSPKELGALLTWMSDHNQNMLAMGFVKTIPSQVLEKWPVPLALVQIHTHLKEWARVEELTKNADWRDYEFIRHAFLARAYRETDNPAGAERQWAEATKAATQNESLLVLAKMAGQWQWTNETVDLLWSLAQSPEKQQQALQTLYSHYAESDDTRGLYRVLLRLYELDPTNLDVQNNLAQVGLLLHADITQAQRLATDLYARRRDNIAYITTYAYSLLTKGDTAGAVAIMKSLTESQLQDPAISAYYGICLGAADDLGAVDFLERGKAAKLLPEERELVEKALGHLALVRRSKPK